MLCALSQSLRLEIIVACDFYDFCDFEHACTMFDQSKAGFGYALIVIFCKKIKK